MRRTGRRPVPRHPIRDRDIITDHIAEITGSGIELTSGRHLDADIIVAATGLNVLVIGGMALTVDGHRIRLSDTCVHPGGVATRISTTAMAGSGVPGHTQRARQVAGQDLRPERLTAPPRRWP